MFALPPRHSQCFAEDRAGIVCRKGSRAALLAVPAFFTLFFSLLFSLWYLESVSAWLALAGATLVLSMSAATAMFWLASGRSGRPDPGRSQRQTASPPLPTGAAAEARTQPVPLRMNEMRTVDCSACQHSDNLFKVDCFKTDCGANGFLRELALREKSAPETGAPPATPEQ